MVMPDAAVFIDTGWEPLAVYRHLAWLMLLGVLPFPVYLVSVGYIWANLLVGGIGEVRASIPAFIHIVPSAGTCAEQAIT